MQKIRHYRGTELRSLPKQFFWDEQTKQKFEELTAMYDRNLSANEAILKLIEWAVDEQWVPGYIRKTKQEPPIQNQAASTLDSLRPDKTVFRA